MASERPDRPPFGRHTGVRRGYGSDRGPRHGFAARPAVCLQTTFSSEPTRKDIVPTACEPRRRLFGGC